MLRNLSRNKLPFTPVRRFFADVLCQPPAFGKRTRCLGWDDDFLDGYPPYPSPGFERDSPTRANKYSVALLNEVAADDAVVVSALDDFPFCCHADLCMMPRDALEDVARALNDRLPAALQIDLSAEREDAYIRNAVELLVGLRTAGTLTPPPTPTHARRAQVPPEPVSPLARRSRPRAHEALSMPLRAAREEFNEDPPDGEIMMAYAAPSSKKRKLATIGDLKAPCAPLPLRRSLTTSERSESRSPIAKRMRRSLSLRPSDGGKKKGGDAGVMRQRQRYRPRGGVGRRTTSAEMAAAEVAANELAGALGGLSLASPRSVMDVNG